MYGGELSKTLQPSLCHLHMNSLDSTGKYLVHPRPHSPVPGGVGLALVTTAAADRYLSSFAPIFNAFGAMSVMWNKLKSASIGGDGQQAAGLCSLIGSALSEATRSAYRKFSIRIFCSYYFC